MNKMVSVGSAIAVALVSFSVSAEKLQVDTPTTLTTSGTYDGAEINAALTLDDGAAITVSNAVSVRAKVTTLPKTKFLNNKSGDATFNTVGVTFDGAGGFDVSCFYYKDNVPQLAFDDPYIGLWIRRACVPASATTEAETFDVLTLRERATADITTFTNFNAKAARYLFAGGVLRASYITKSGLPSFVAPAGKTIILEGVDGNPIMFVPQYEKPTYTFRDEGTFQTQGNCDFILGGIGDSDSIPAPDCKKRDDDPNKGAANNPNRAWMKLTSNGTWNWNHAGDFRIQEYAWLRLSADDRLPSGPNTGSIRLESKTHTTRGGSGTSHPRLDMNGYSSYINGLIADDDANVTNFARCVTSTLKFGHYKDGVLQAKVCGNIDVEKVGSATTLTVSDASLPQAFRIKEGTVRVTAGTTGKVHLGAIDLAAGATLVIDGVSATFSSFKGVGTVSCVNGGELVAQASATGPCYLYTADAALSASRIHAASGMMVFTGDLCTNEWWRFRFRENKGSIEIGRIGLFEDANQIGAHLPGSSVKNLCGGITPCDAAILVSQEATRSNYTYVAETATAPENLPRGKALFTPGKIFRKWRSGRVADDLQQLFLGSGAAESFEISGQASGAAIDPYDESTWADVTFRLAAGKNMARRYSFYGTTWAGAALPKSWVVESSSDGINWERMDDCEIADPLKTYFTDAGQSYNWYDYPDGFVFTSGRMSGAKGFDSAAQVQVDAGATLDCLMVDEGQVVSSLAYDATLGAGKLIRVTFAETGAMDITTTASRGSRIVIPYVFEGCSGVANLANWTVTVNGKAVVDGRTLQVTDEGLVLPPTGLMLFVR